MACFAIHIPHPSRNPVAMGGFTRVDKRPNHAIRPFAFYLNPLRNGPSCKIVVGNIKNEDGELTGIGGRTSVVAILLVSTEVKSKNTVGSFHKPYIEVFIRPPSGTRGSRAGNVKSSIRAMEAVLVKVVQRLVNPEKLGRVTLSFRIQVMEDAGGLLAACINALVLVLALSGIQMNALPYAVSFGLVRPESGPADAVILDPTDYEVRTYCTTAVTVLSDPDTGRRRSRPGDLSLVTVDAGSGCFGDSLGQIRTLARATASKCLGTFEQLRTKTTKSPESQTDQ